MSSVPYLLFFKQYSCKINKKDGYPQNFIKIFLAKQEVFLCNYLSLNIILQCLDWLRRHSCYEGIVRDIMRYDGSCSDNAVVADMYTREDYSLTANPDIIANVDRFD